MRLLRKIFRYPAQDVMFIITLVISCFLVADFSLSKQKMQCHRGAVHPYDIQMCIDFNGAFYFIEEFPDEPLFKTMDAFEFGVIMFPIIGKDDYSGSTRLDVIYSLHEEFLFPLKGGVSFEDISSGESVVLLGEGWRDKVYKSQGEDRINLCGLNMKVGAFLEDYSFRKDNMTVYILWNSFSEEDKQKLLSYEHFPWGALSVYTNGNYEKELGECTSYFRNLLVEENIRITMIWDGKSYETAKEEELRDNPLETAISDIDGLSYTDEWYQNFCGVLYPCCIAFALFISYHALSLWLRKRSYECAVRLAMGYTKRRLRAFILQKVFLRVFASLVIAIALHYILFHREIGVVLEVSMPGELIKILCIGVLIMLATCSLCIVRSGRSLLGELREE